MLVLQPMQLSFGDVDKVEYSYWNCCNDVFGRVEIDKGIEIGRLCDCWYGSCQHGERWRTLI